jgi:hypothetical protein
MLRCPVDGGPTAHSLLLQRRDVLHQQRSHVKALVTYGEIFAKGALRIVLVALSGACGLAKWLVCAYSTASDTHRARLRFWKDGTTGTRAGLPIETYQGTSIEIGHSSTLRWGW